MTVWPIVVGTVYESVCVVMVVFQLLAFGGVSCHVFEKQRLRKQNKSKTTFPPQYVWLIDWCVCAALSEECAYSIVLRRVQGHALLSEKKMYRKQMWLLLNNGISCEDSRESVAKMSNCWWVNGYEILVMM